MSQFPVMMQADNPWMQRALEQAQHAEALGEVPIGAILVAPDGITCLAENHNRTRIDCDPSAHAEIVVLRNAARAVGAARLPGCQLYVTLEPCPMCAGAIIQSRIARLVFGAYDVQYGAITHGIQLFARDDINHRPEAIGGVAETACRKILEDFFAARRCDHY